MDMLKKKCQEKIEEKGLYLLISKYFMSFHAVRQTAFVKKIYVDACTLFSTKTENF